MGRKKKEVEDNVKESPEKISYSIDAIIEIAVFKGYSRRQARHEDKLIKDITNFVAEEWDGEFKDIVKFYVETYTDKLKRYSHILEFPGYSTMSHYVRDTIESGEYPKDPTEITKFNNAILNEHWLVGRIVEKMLQVKQRKVSDKLEENIKNKRLPRYSEIEIVVGAKFAGYCTEEDVRDIDYFKVVEDLKYYAEYHIADFISSITTDKQREDLVLLLDGGVDADAVLRGEYEQEGVESLYYPISLQRSLIELAFKNMKELRDAGKFKVGERKRKW